MSKRKKKFRVKMRGRNKDFEIVTNIERRSSVWGEQAHHMGFGGEGAPHGGGCG